MIVKVWRLIEKRFCDLCQKDITGGNSYSTTFEDETPDTHYCSNKCGDTLKVLREIDEANSTSIKGTEGGHQMNNKS
jgi:hypothetical protein